ncbi:MAG: hypothetical protein AAF560_22225 [Acidobacteriota bacterium]
MILPGQVLAEEESQPSNAAFQQRAAWPPFGAGHRYCEILLVKRQGTNLEAEVWGTPGLNDCPAASWEALDPDQIRAEEDALAVQMNGPRIWLPNVAAGSPPSRELKRFGGLEMRRLATVEIDSAQGLASYTESTVQRKTTFNFPEGTEIYELESPAGSRYVMQSMSQIHDPDLTLAELPALGSRLELPEGWTFRARTLEADLILVADGQAVVLQDELSNTYQRVNPGEGSSTPDASTVNSSGLGTLCESDQDCQGFEADHCLKGRRGGMCTIEGCELGDCGGSFVCCSGCRRFAAAFLPFKGSACVPEAQAAVLTGRPGCKCE